MCGSGLTGGEERGHAFWGRQNVVDGAQIDTRGVGAFVVLSAYAANRTFKSWSFLWWIQSR